MTVEISPAPSLVSRLKLRAFAGDWTAALIWGIGVALVHRLVLLVWLAGLWTMLEPTLNTPVNFHDPGESLPALTTRAEELAFGVWRRWDAVHYLTLATDGYQVDHPGPTVFGPLTPLAFRAFDALLPGGLDLGAMVFETLAFAAALTFLYRVCIIYYRDSALAPWAVVTLAIIPMGYVFAAPLSEAPYLAFVLALFYFGARGRWGWAALCAILATLARSQGLLLTGVAALLLLERLLETPAAWRVRLIQAIRQSGPIALIPAGYLAFLVFRQTQNLPPLFDIYRDYSSVFFTHPIDGFLINLRYLLAHPSELIATPDLAAFVLVPLLIIGLFVSRAHRRPALIAYTVGFFAFALTKVNYVYGTDQIWFTQSLARYSAVLFPLAVLVADGLRRAPGWLRLIGVGGLVLVSLGFAALNMLAILGP